jgi:pimeloyl-ACP methyl ester carboxylesterase
MPAFLVHGNPDSSRLWDRVKQHLGDYDGEVVAGDMPGFRDPAPAGFPATKEAYVDWICEECEKLGGNVDLVGHDWGSLLVQRVASVRPDLLNTVACGGAAVDESYPWHPLAQVWQTPGEGERYMAEELTPEFGIEHLVENGVPREDAEHNIWLTDHGKDSILKIYRSAIEIGGGMAARPGAPGSPGNGDLGPHRPLRPARIRRSPGQANEGRARGPRVRPLVAFRASR